MTEVTVLRIRRLPDERRRVLWDRARYEIEWTSPGEPTERVVTVVPHVVVARLTGSTHPADTSVVSGAADLAWDGGVGPWRESPLFEAEGLAEPATRAPGEMDDDQVRRRAAAFVRRAVGRAPTSRSALAALAPALHRVGHPVVAAALGELADELLVAHTPDQRARLRARAQRVWAEHDVASLRPRRGSRTEWAVCAQLVAEVPELLASNDG